MKKLKVFTLDYSKWRSGVNGENKVGKGVTQLCNTSGFMCCLGQMVIQQGVQKIELTYHSCPSQLLLYIPVLTLKNKLDGYHRDTKFSSEAININDDTITTPGTKLFLLRKLFATKGIKLIVKNCPDKVLKEYRKLCRNSK
jgi:hypothetical protein